MRLVGFGSRYGMHQLRDLVIDCCAVYMRISRQEKLPRLNELRRYLKQHFNVDATPLSCQRATQQSNSLFTFCALCGTFFNIKMSESL